MQLMLNAGWQFKRRDAALPLNDDFAHHEGWSPAQVPGTIHQDLLAAGMIHDPFVGRNEMETQWVAEQDWLYRCTFTHRADSSVCVDLVCAGLDTFANIWVNGVLVLTSDNMFVSHRIPIQALLHTGENEVRVLFESALRRGRAIDAQQPTLIEQAWAGERNRFHVRKAQYHYGWDWGPVLVTAGIWQPMSVEYYDVRIASLDCVPLIADALDAARFPVALTLAGDLTQATHVHIALYSPAGTMLAEATLPAKAQLEQDWEIQDPALWWPNGYGEHPLYHITATLHHGTQALATSTLRVGVRQVQLMQPTLDGHQGSAFWFEVNHVPIFCGGANWIPADFFTTRLTPECYRASLDLAAQAHMTMVRVWGGGIYEPESFYDICDELGILIWQDFMFACGMYPAYDTFVASVRVEAEEVVTRLRHHACLALWCGNNEDYMVAGSIGAYDPTFQGDFRATRFPAREIYEHLLPAICAAFDPTRPYWPGSPYGGLDGNGSTCGDQHIWNVWHHQMAPYQEYGNIPARFVSEFGMQSLPARATIEAFTSQEERYPQSATLEFHNKGERGVRRLTTYIVDNVRIPHDLDGYIYASQLVQAEAVAAGFRGWRRLWNQQRLVGGALVWQLDDCWPGTSWALIDYYRRPKPAYYTARRALAPIVVEMAHTTNGRFAVWAVNDTAEPFGGEVVLDAWAADGTQLHHQTVAVMLAARLATECGAFTFDEHALMISATLLREGQPSAHACLWLEPLKYKAFHEPRLTVERVGEQIMLIARTPVKGLWLDGGDGVTWSDNMLDLVPSVPVTIHARGLGERPIAMRYLT